MSDPLRLVAMLLYYGLGSHLPNTHVPGGRLSSDIRAALARRFLGSCGRNVTIGSGVSFGRGDDVAVGSNVQINEDCHIRNAIIGDLVMIGPEVMMLNLGHTTTDTSQPMIEQPKRTYPPTVIENDVWLGARALLLPGIRIGRGAVVGAGAVVTKDVQPYTIVGGNPARVIRHRINTGTVPMQVGR